jgi:hypothetical protein
MSRRLKPKSKHGASAYRHNDRCTCCGEALSDEKSLKVGLCPRCRTSIKILTGIQTIL